MGARPLSTALFTVNNLQAAVHTDINTREISNINRTCSCLQTDIIDSEVFTNSGIVSSHTQDNETLKNVTLHQIMQTAAE